MADLFNPNSMNWNAVVGEADRAFRRGVLLDKVSRVASGTRLRAYLY
jgi:hypothetical protein